MMKIRRSLLSATAVALLAGTGLASCQQAEDDATTEATEAEGAGSTEAGDTESETATNAKALLKAMSDYLAAQDVISLDYNSIFEVVSDDKQKLQIATSGTAVLDRPGNIRTTRKSGFSDTEMVFDGTTLSLFGAGQNAYIQTEAPGTVDQLIDQLRDKFHRQLPGADLLQSNVYENLMTDVTDIKDLGSGIVNGVECDHLAFRAKDTDWQIWIAQGDEPYPCRYVITSKGVDQAPQFTLEVSNWKAGAAAGTANFTFTPPAGATRMDIADIANLRDTADLPENYRIGADQ